MKWAFVLVLAACGDARSIEPVPKPAETEPTPVTRLELGQCAQVTVTFVSGPKPVPPWEYGPGPGAGGPGIGTIGGTAAGRIHIAPTSQVTLGQPNIEGNLDKAIIRRYLRRNLEKIRLCYEKQLANRKLEGTVVVSFTITATGSVSDARAEGLDPTVDRCVRDVISKIEFPHAKGGGIVKVTYPFTFGPLKPEQPKPAPAWTPDLWNPLREHRSAMLACAMTPFGAGVVDFAYDANGAVTAAKVHGVDDATATCIANVAKLAKRIGGIVSHERCAFAFGVMTPKDAPGIDITETTERTIVENLVEAIRAPAAPVAIRGPAVLRANPNVSMAIISEAVQEAQGAGAKDVLLSISPDSWVPASAVVLPVVPVPENTGTAWLDKALTRAELAEISLGAPMPPDIVVNMQPDAIVVGAVTIPKTVAGYDWTRVAEELVKHKASPSFADRDDIELLVDNKLRVKDMLDLVEVVVASKWKRWRILY